MSMFEADLEAFGDWWLDRRHQTTSSEHSRRVRPSGPALAEGESKRNPNPPSAPTIRSVRAYVGEVAERSDWAAHGAVRALKVWSKFLAEEAGREDPLATLKYRKQPETSRTPVATEDDIEALLATCSDDSLEDVRDRAILCLLGATGMRRGELVKMRWDDLDMTQRTVHLPNESTKTGRGRTVAFDNETLRALRKYLHRVDRFELDNSLTGWRRWV